MEIYPLLYFTTVADMGNLTRASNFLDVSPSSVSCAIKKLEDDLGTPLFDRVGRNIVLNKYGIAYMAYAKKILAINALGNECLRQMLESHDMVVNIADNTNVFASHIISEFLREYPDISIHRTFINAEQSATVRLTDNYDFIIGSANNIRRPDLTYEYIRLGHTVRAIMNKENRLAMRKSLLISDIKGEPFITFVEGFSGRIMLNYIFDKINETPQIVFEGNNPHAMTPALSQNLGILLQGGPAAKFNMEAQHLYNDCISIPITDCYYESNTSLFWDSTNTMSKSAKLFKKFSEEFSKKYHLIDE